MSVPEDRLTQKQEIFCVKYVSGMSSVDSAIAAGYSLNSADVIASENLAKPKIIARIAELRRIPIEGLQITRESQLRDLEMVKQKSMAVNQYKPFISAIQEQNKMLGYYATEKKDINITGVQIVTKDEEMKSLLSNLINDDIVVNDDGTVGVD